jgi:hypothetical protein
MRIKEGIMLNRCFTLIGLIAAVAILSGCGKNLASQKETMLDRSWGRSFESAKRKQILNPEAGKDTSPVTGLDGQAAEGSIEGYRKGFEGRPSKNTYELNLGNISGIGTE